MARAEHRLIDLVIFQQAADIGFKIMLHLTGKTAYIGLSLPFAIPWLHEEVPQVLLQGTVDVQWMCSKIMHTSNVNQDYAPMLQRARVFCS